MTKKLTEKEIKLFVLTKHHGKEIYSWPKSCWSKQKYKNRRCYTRFDKSEEFKYFHSNKEAKKYIDYRYLEIAKEISELECQVKFKFPMNIAWIADFTYIDNNRVFHVIDAKGYLTRTYIDKKKMFEYFFAPLKIEEV